MKTEEMPSDTEIRITRLVEASRERVWRALTDPKELDQWWGPTGFRNVTKTWEFNPGGMWKHVMIGPDGAEYPNATKFVEIVENDHITYANAGGKKGEKGVNFRMTFSLKALGPSRTEVEIHQVFETREDRDFVVKRFGAIEGGKQTLGKLSEHVAKPGPGKPEFELKLERVIDAPRARVFEAWAKPEQVAKWFAPKPLTLRVDKMELRSGGSFKMAMVWPDGRTHDFGGTYVEVVPLEKIVWTGEFPGDPKDNIRTEVVFEDAGGKTKLKVRQTFAVVTEISRQPTQGAKQGWTMTLDQLEEWCARNSRG